MVKKFPYLIGDFVWTSWDYIGEAGIGAWAYTGDGKVFNKPYPWLLADVGTIDILGNPGASAAYAKVVWGLEDEPYIGVRPVNKPGIKPSKGVWRGTNAFDSWAWHNCDGNKAEVEVYANASYVELYLNGKRIGKKKIKACKTMFKMRYKPGTLMVIAFNSAGEEIGRKTLQSATGKTKIQARVEEKSIKVGDIAYIDIAIVGENNVIESNADCKITATVEGGELLALGSANPRTEERYTDGSFTTYYGRAQAVVRGDRVGELKIYLSGESHETVVASISVRE